MILRAPAPIALVLGLALVLAGCSAGAPSPSDPPPSSSAPPSSPTPTTSASPAPSAAGAALLLKVTSEGGLIAPGATLATLPLAAVYTDGRILTPAAVPAIYPGPLLQSFQVRDVGATGAAAIADAIRAAGLDAPVETDPGVAGDAGTTVFTAVLDGATTTARFPGLGGGGRPDLSGTTPAAAAAFALLDRLNDPSDAWGGPANPPTLYTPAGYRIFVAPGAPAADPQVPQNPLAWPLPTPLADFGIPAEPDHGIAGLRSGVVLGDDAATLAPFLAAANTLTPVISDGRAYTLFVRPLLPDESGGPCCGGG